METVLSDPRKEALKCQLARASCVRITWRVLKNNDSQRSCLRQSETKRQRNREEMTVKEVYGSGRIIFKGSVY